MNLRLDVWLNLARIKAKSNSVICLQYSFKYGCNNDKCNHDESLLKFNIKEKFEICKIMV